MQINDGAHCLFDAFYQPVFSYSLWETSWPFYAADGSAIKELAFGANALAVPSYLANGQ